MKYVATISFTAQVSPDDWALLHKHMEVTPETTVKEILEWTARISPNKKGTDEFVVREMESKS